MLVRNASSGPNITAGRTKNLVERGSDRQFAFAALSDVAGRRGGIGADS